MHKKLKCTQYEPCLLTLLTLKMIYISDYVLLLVPRVAWQLLASSVIWSGSFLLTAKIVVIPA